VNRSRSKLLTCCSFSFLTVAFALLSTLMAFPSAASAQQTWYVQVGAESKNEAKQVDAFLPNEIWIYVGDSITFKFAPKNEIHTVTFLQPGQDRPAFSSGPPGVPVGCSAVDSETVSQPSGSTYDGASDLACVNSGPMDGGATYTVKFTQPGNYKMVCLVHTDMYGVVHVLQNTDSSAPFYAASLPYEQSDYDAQARDEARDLLTRSITPSEEDSDFSPMENVVLMTGVMSATAGGRQYMSLVRFIPGTIRIHAGETVEWINTDPTEPHTVTFGPEGGNPAVPVGVTMGPDGAWEATISSPNQSVSSGFLQAAPQDKQGQPQNAPGKTRIRITFTKPGAYHYICALHDVDGMVGTVIVLP
jgi:plastocyanin